MQEEKKKDKVKEKGDGEEKARNILVIFNVVSFSFSSL